MKVCNLLFCLFINSEFSVQIFLCIRKKVAVLVKKVIKYMDCHKLLLT